MAHVACEYPGTFALGADRLVLTVPRSSVGGPVPGQARLFLDWSDASLGVLAVSGSDAVPDRGRVDYG